jgi:hypothetical protein
VEVHALGAAKLGSKGMLGEMPELACKLLESEDELCASAGFVLLLALLNAGCIMRSKNTENCSPLGAELFESSPPVVWPAPRVLVLSRLDSELLEMKGFSEFRLMMGVFECTDEFFQCLGASFYADAHQLE